MKHAAAWPLYLSDDELGRFVMGERAKEWPAKHEFLKKKHPTFPQFDPLMGGYPRQAVEAFFLHRHGLDPANDGQTMRNDPHIRVVISPVETTHAPIAPATTDRRATSHPRRTRARATT